MKENNEKPIQSNSKQKKKKRMSKILKFPKIDEEPNETKIPQEVIDYFDSILLEKNTNLVVLGKDDFLLNKMFRL